MTFASTLNEYCKIAECTNLQIAELSGVSPSTLSRYRHGERKPESDGPIVRKIAEALSQLSAENNPGNPLSFDEIHVRLARAIVSPPIAGMNFNARLDMLMSFVGARNIDVAEVIGVDSSYISRIRRGQRMPSDMHAFARAFSHLASNICIERDLLGELGELVDAPEITARFPPNFPNRESEIAEVIEVWLTGGQMFATDMSMLDELFKWIDTTDFSPRLSFRSYAIGSIPEDPIPVSRFYHGIRGMHNAELKFLETAAKAHARTLLLSSDTPVQQMEVDPSLKRKYALGIEEALLNGSRFDVLYNIERPLEDTIKSLRFWIPFYITGRVTPYYLKGVNNRLFTHVNFVSDACILSAESVVGHLEDGRCYFSTRPEDIAYYQKKMSFILEQALPLIEIYRECDPERYELFLKAENGRKAKGNGRQIRTSVLKNVRITSYPGDCGVMTIPCGDQLVHLVSRHPKINYMASRMQ